MIHWYLVVALDNASLVGLDTVLSMALVNTGVEVPLYGVDLPEFRSLALKNYLPPCCLNPLQRPNDF